MGKVKDVVSRVLNVPAREMFPRAVKKGISCVVSEARLRQARRGGVYIGHDEFLNLKRGIGFPFEVGGNSLEELAEKLKFKDLILSKADSICNGEFELMGLGQVCVGKEIDWLLDYRSGFRWKNEFHRKIEVSERTNEADIRFVWEMSRLQHLFVLGKAYEISRDERYSSEFVRHIKSWTDQNPPYMSVNWTCAMEVAIRACNLMLAEFFFREAPGIVREFWTSFDATLYMHGVYIFENLENHSSIRSNHYIADLAGLVWLGLYFGNVGGVKGKRAALWLKRGVRGIESEVERQINGDGTDYEASTAYHCLVLEILLYTVSVCKGSGIGVSDEVLDKIESMCEFLEAITKPDGTIPLIGDMDSGRFIVPAALEERRDFRNILSLGKVVLEKGENRSHIDEEAAWLGKRDFKPSDRGSGAYPEGGYYVYKSKRIYTVIRCGRNGMGGVGAHSHNDQLSFELCVDGLDFIVDPGTFIYSGDYDMRNLFRSTRWHNTLQIDDFEQNSFDENELFAMNDESHAIAVSHSNEYFRGRHLGYLKKTGVIHERSFEFSDSGVVIRDAVLNEESSVKENVKIVRFHLDPEVEVDLKADRAILKRGGIKLELVCELPVLNTCPTLISKGYGHIQDSKCIYARFESGEIGFELSI